MEDANDPGYQIMHDEESVEDVLKEREESESGDEAPSSAVTPSQACAAFDSALEWLESKGNTPCTSYACKKLERRCSSASLEIHETN